MPLLCGLCPVASGLSRPGAQRSQEALTLAQELSHPYSLGFALSYAAMSIAPPGGETAQEQAEAAIALATEQDFRLLSAGTYPAGLGAG